MNTMLNQVADGVWVRQSAWVWSNAIAVRGEGGLILVDPGIDGSELNQFADDLDGLGLPVVAGFSTHPHWDHLLWHSRFGGVPRYATPAGAHAAGEARERAQRMAAESASGIPLELIGLLTPLPADGGPVPGGDRRASGARHRPRRGPPRGPWRPARRRHALRRPDPALRPSPPRSGGRLRDGTRPAGGGRQAHRCPGPRPRRRCRGSRGGGPPGRRSCLHRRAAPRRGTGRPTSGSRLALRHPPVEPGAGPILNRMNFRRHRVMVATRSWPAQRSAAPRPGLARTPRWSPGSSPSELTPARNARSSARRRVRPYSPRRAEGAREPAFWRPR